MTIQKYKKISCYLLQLASELRSYRKDSRDVDESACIQLLVCRNHLDSPEYNRHSELLRRCGDTSIWNCARYRYAFRCRCRARSGKSSREWRYRLGRAPAGHGYCWSRRQQRSFATHSFAIQPGPRCECWRLGRRWASA
jgi:hypothetical protein